MSPLCHNGCMNDSNPTIGVERLPEDLIITAMRNYWLVTAHAGSGYRYWRHQSREWLLTKWQVSSGKLHHDVLGFWLQCNRRTKIDGEWQPWWLKQPWSEEYKPFLTDEHNRE